MSEYAKTHALDVDDFEVARSIHRVIRAMHDGECPKCHRLFQPSSVVAEKGFYSYAADPKEDKRCPNCGFTISRAEIDAALARFAPVMEKNLEVFEQWRKTRQLTPAELVDRVKALPPEERERAERALLLKYAKPGESKFVDETRAVLGKTENPL